MMSKKSKQKIINWLKNWIQKNKYDIDIKIAPTVTLFGIISISPVGVKIAPRPEEWNEEDKRKIANFLDKELKLSLEEFVRCLKEEIEKIREDELKSILNKINKIAEVITENSLIPLGEFERRSEIEQLFVYETFIGRESELEELHRFLEANEKIMVIIGDGGTGKTRLAIEFAKQIENKNWIVYFINPNILFKVYFKIPPPSKNIFLILDDASRYDERNRDKVIEFVRNPPNYNVKLLLLDRTIFERRIKNYLRDKDVTFQDHELKKGDIVSFLEKYFKVEYEVTEEIERECMNNFVWAAFFGEFYREESRVGKLKDVMKNRIEKYIRDISVIAPRITIENIKNILFLLSLVTPVEWRKDRDYFKKILEENLLGYDHNDLTEIIPLHQLLQLKKPRQNSFPVLT